MDREWTQQAQDLIFALDIGTRSIIGMVGRTEGERVQIWNVTNGERLDTYVIRGRRGSGAICLNGAAARKAQVGDVLIIASYARMEFEEAKTFRPWVVFPDTATNRLVE